MLRWYFMKRRSSQGDGVAAEMIRQRMSVCVRRSGHRFPYAHLLLCKSDCLTTLIASREYFVLSSLPFPLHASRTSREDCIQTVFLASSCRGTLFWWWASADSPFCPGLRFPLISSLYIVLSINANGRDVLSLSAKWVWYVLMLLLRSTHSC